MKKTTSTNTINEIYWKKNCGLSYTLSLIGGRWKINILGYLLNEQTLRFSELKNRLVGISERMLSSSLQELEKDGLVRRIVYPQVPPKVEYELTDSGKTLKDIISAMDDWGETQLQKSK